ncbi:MAG: Stk1 family PASTA domain-containing Ser/Thr kinase [Candidatus Nanopelagicales bacterium]|nr:Stk1 family PASTA domain-containing Ser/Thr kinase [Candidatus Nanopelagicales bacterium]
MSDVRRLGDRYQVGELLGRGGMAEVHEGRDLRLGRRVAIKILKPELARDPAFLTRFRREAQSAASLNHPNVVAVYDTGEDVLGEGATAQTVPFIVMELVEGITLKELLGSGNKLVPERALEITSGVLAALDYSHRHGIVHRDIKPGNVMLTTTGAVKVMDFGIARATADAGQTATTTSTIMGTAAYLSPEQAQGLGVDSRSDLYSTGVVLFELLTRRPPFVADAPVAVAFAHVNEPPPVPSVLDPTLPPQLDPIVARALAKDPAQRYQTAVEFRADVERAIAGVPVTRVMPVAPLVGPDSQATAVMGGVDLYATAAMAATGAMPPVIPGGAGGPHATEPMTDDPPRKGRALKGVAVAALVIALIGVGAWFGVRLLGSVTPETVEVPRLEGLTVAAAETELRDVDLRLGETVLQASDLPPDTVISQDPRSGELAEVGSLVDIVVSKGKEQVQVPDLIDVSSESDARRALSEAGLSLGRVTEEDSDRPEGMVLRQDPEPYETVDAGSTVDIWVSNAQVTVPNVVGRTEAQARTDLFNQGFEVAYAPEVETTEFAPGTVIDQTPEGGQSAKKGSLVTLTLAKAPVPTPTPTPTPTPSVPADGGGADGAGGDGAANSNPGLSATPAP